MMSADTSTIVASVDSVLVVNLNNTADRIAPHGSKNAAEALKQGNPAAMQSYKLIQSDMNVDLWQSALHATLRDISSSTYPHYIAIQNILNYTLNCHKYTDFGLVSLVMSKLLANHPPGSKTTSSYYRRILEDKYAKVRDNHAEDQSFFWAVVDMVKNAGKTAEILYQPHPLVEEDRDESVKDTLQQLNELSKTKSVTFYIDLSLEEQRKRSTMCLQYLCDILADDFKIWLAEIQKDFKRKSRCLLGRLLWPNETLEGFISPNIQRVITLQEESFMHMGQTTRACEKLLSITAELMRTFDQHKNMQYPFLGPLTQAFAREFSSFLIARYDQDKLMSYLQRVEPPWLRLLTTTHILSHLAGFQCQPELFSAITIMEHLEHVYKMGRQQTRLLQIQDRPPANPEMVSKFSKLKSVNACFRSGLSRLQSACYDDNVEAVRALLTFPSLDLNQTDATGWTALHIAVRRGSELCVREMLSHVPPVDSVQRRVDTRARGPANYTPLMCAVQAGQTDICSLLLKHTGSVLLEDITDENQTAIDLCESPEIFRILQEFKIHKVETIYSRKELHMNTGNLPLVARLCTTLIQSYFAVHCTWKVYHAIKLAAKNKQTFTTVPNALFEYSRYHRDFKTNLPKIRSMAMKLKKIPQLASPIQILVCLVSLNKA